MKKIYYYIPIVLVFCILSNIPVKAYTTSVNLNVPVNNGTTMVLQTQSYTDLLPESTTQENDGLTTYANYSPTFNLMLQNTNQQYLNGWAIINFSVSVALAGGSNQFSFNGLDYIRPDSSNGLNVFVGTVTSNQFRIFVYFDNYYNQAGNSDLGQITMNYTAAYGDISPMKASFTITPTLTGSGINKTTGIINDRETELIYNAIYQATGQNFVNILTFLNTISTQDYTFYTSLLNELSQSNTFLQHIKNYTENISSKINTININVAEIMNDLETYITFMNTYIPYLQNISTNTLNTYNQLKTIYNYMMSRPQRYYTNSNYYIYKSDQNKFAFFENIEGRKSILIKKSDLINYIYMQPNRTTSMPEIIYLKDDPSNYDDGTIVDSIVTRYEFMDQNTFNKSYIAIDFKYDEEYAIINLYTNLNPEIKAYIGDGYTYQALLYYIENMINMNPEQESEAAIQSSEYADRDNQSQQLINGMGSVTMPSLAAGDLDILSGIDTTQKINFFGLIALITHNELITKIMLVIVMGAIVGWILYGKK